MTKPGRKPGPARGPLTHAEMRAMRAEGDSIVAIAQKAYVRNRLSRAEVRAILFGGDGR